MKRKKFQIKVSETILFFCLAFASKVFAQTADVSTGCIPLVVNFTAPSTSVTYFWDFGNGTTSILNNPSASYTNPGNYTVIFRASPNGPDLGSIPITVYASPILNVTSNISSGCSPLSVNLRNNVVIDPAIPILNYGWVFGDGKKATTGTNRAVHTFIADNLYSVSGSIVTPFSTCDRTEIFPDLVRVFEVPLLTIKTNPNPASSCFPPLRVSIDNLSSGLYNPTYSWNFGNGNTSTEDDPDDQYYTVGGNFQIQLIGQNDMGCRDTLTKPVSVADANITINVPDTVCKNDLVTFAHTGTGNVTWDFDYGAITANGYAPITVSNASTIDVIFNSQGTRTISLTVRQNNCTRVVTKEVYVQGIPINTTITESYSCENPVTINYTAASSVPGASYQWTFFDGTTSAGSTASYTYFDARDTMYFGINEESLYPTSVLVTNGNTGCFDTSFVDFVHFPADARLLPTGGSPRGCAPLTVSFRDTSIAYINDPIVSWTWHWDDGTPDETYNDSNDVSHTFTTPGIYETQVFIENTSGCRDTSYVLIVEVGDDLSAQLDFTANPTTVCPQDTVTLTVTQAPPEVQKYHFYSEGNRTHHSPDDTVVKWLFNSEIGSHDVELMVDYHGCLSSLTKTDYITVEGAIAEINYGANCEDPLTYRFRSLSQGVEVLEWQFGDGATSSDSLYAHTYAAPGDYLVTLKAEDISSGCPASIKTKAITITDPEAFISVDPIGCSGEEFIVYARGSSGADCRGYTYNFPTMDNQRPIKWGQDSLIITLPRRSDSSAIGQGPERHTIEVIITDIHGCKDTASTEMALYDINLGAAASRSEICTPSTILFSDSTISDTTITAWYWILSNGDTLNEQNPSYTFTSPPANDAYYVSLFVENALGCVSEVADSILKLNYYEIESSITHRDRICGPAEVRFAATDYTAHGSNLSFFWNFGNGEKSTQMIDTITYTTAGRHRVRLTFTEIASGCSKTIRSSQRVQLYPQAGFFSDVDEDSVICAPSAVTFTDTSRSVSGVSSRRWDFGNGETGNTNAYSLTYPRGTYDVKLILSTSYGCRDTASNTYTVIGPEGRFTMDNNDICKGDSILFTLEDTLDVESWVWFFGDGTDTADVSPISHTYSFIPPSFQTVASINFATKGCNVSYDTIIHFTPIIADFIRNDGIDTSICIQNNLFPFTDNSTNPENYSWDFGDGLGTSDLANPSYTYAKSGIYDVRLAIENLTYGCVDTMVRKIIITDPPDTKLRLSTDTICLGDTLFLNVLSPMNTSNYTWGASEPLFDVTNVSASVILPISDSVSLTESDYNNCITTLDTFITVIPHFKYIDWDTTILIGDYAELPINIGKEFDFILSPDERLSCVNCNYPRANPTKDIVYNLNISDLTGCFSDDYKYTVFVNPLAVLNMPSTFSPNGDGANDVVYARGLRIRELVSYKIFNRWGQLIFETNDLDVGWDGTFNGVIQNSEVYVYQVIAISLDGFPLEAEGYIHLIK